MKYLFFVIAAVYILAGCKKEEPGNLKQQIKCTTRQTTQNFKSLKSNEDLKYTQFGDFIMSITPTSFVGEIGVVRYYAENESGSFMTLIFGDSNDGGEVVMADFSRDSVLSVIPTLNGTNIMENSDGQGSYFSDNVTFKVLWIGMGLVQVLELPDNYSQVNLYQFNSNQKVDNIITSDIVPFFQAVEELSTIGRTFTIYFGMADSTYIAVDESERHFLGNNTLPHIRSTKYNEWTMTPPLPGQTKTIVSTIGFYINDIIQVYAGADNIPYTGDDIFVLEPKFWERIYVNVSEN